MAIAKSNILFYWDHRNREVPTVGGQPTFSRAGNAFEMQAEGHHVERYADTPRFEPDGLLLEGAQTNQLAAGVCFNANDADWSGWLGVKNSITSIFDGETARQYSSTASSHDINSTVGTFTTTDETAFFIIEKMITSNGDQSVIRVHNDTSGNWMAGCTFTWSSATAAAGTYTDSDSEPDVGAVKLVDVGPNGGPVYLVWMTYDPNAGSSGDTRSIRILPVVHASDEVVVHAVQLVESGYLTSPVDGTRVAESLYWDSAPKPQAMVSYCKYIARAVIMDRVWNIGGATGAQMLLYWTGPTSLRAYWDDGATTQFATVTVTVVPGDIVECVFILNSDGSLRFVVRVNGGAVTVQADATGLTLPTSWGYNYLALNGIYPNTTQTAGKFQQLKFVTLASVDSATDGTGTGDEDIMTEMAGLWLSPDGQTVSNTI